MKTLSLIVFTTLCFIGISQTETVIHISSVGSQVQYNFTSNRDIDVFQEEKWESRFKVLHSEIIEIDINNTDEAIQIICDLELPVETLEVIIRRFNIENYLISE